MNWIDKLQIAPTVEPLSLAECRKFGRIDEDNAEPAPPVFTVALAGLGAGNVNTGVHRYLATFVTADGETEAGDISAAVTTTAGNGQVALSAIPLGGSTVTSRKIYRTAAGGSTYLLLATLANNTATTYADNIADSSLGAEAPATNTTEDPVLSRALTAARRYCEDHQSRAYITQTRDFIMDRFPTGDCFYLPRSPITSVTSITYYDTANAVATMLAADYFVDIDGTRPRVVLGYNKSWPSTTLRPANAVFVRYPCGYGAAGSSVPSEILSAIVLLTKHLYANRDFVLTGLIGKELERSFADLLELQKVRFLEPE